MAINATIILDSLNVATGDRLTTFAIRVPKWLLAEVNTHRALSRNASSSRAIPAKKVRHQVLKDPVIPIYFGQTGKGMQSHGELTGNQARTVRFLWLSARYPALFFHWLLSDVFKLSKELSNRLLEPWMWADVLLSGTEWNNFWRLRCHSDAQPEFQAVAREMHELYIYSVPQHLAPGEWHLPFVNQAEKEKYPNDINAISAARCARISYQLFEGGLSTISRDLDLCKGLATPPLHASPFEHVAIALPIRERAANFVGFGQWRKKFNNEANGDYDI